MRATGGEAIYLRKSLAGVASSLFYTPAAYISADTVYTIRVTRSTVNEFAVYIKGGIFANWTLVDTSGGFGPNPVTDTSTQTSLYLGLILDVGGRIYLDRQLLGEVAP